MDALRDVDDQDTIFGSFAQFFDQIFSIGWNVSCIFTIDCIAADNSITKMNQTNLNRMSARRSLRSVDEVTHGLFEW